MAGEPERHGQRAPTARRGAQQAEFRTAPGVREVRRARQASAGVPSRAAVATRTGDSIVAGDDAEDGRIVR